MRKHKNKLVFSNLAYKNNQDKLLIFSGFSFKVEGDESKNKLVKNQADLSLTQVMNVAKTLGISDEENAKESATKSVSSLNALNDLKSNILLNKKEIEIKMFDKGKNTQSVGNNEEQIRCNSTSDE